MARIRVHADGHDLELDGEDGLTFGRARECTICLDPEDTGISRVSGTLAQENGMWWLTNNSSSRPLSVVDEFGFRSVLAPGRRVALETPTKVVVDGTQTRRHYVTLIPERPKTAPEPPSPPASGSSTPTVGADALVSAADRLAMVALFAGYLEDPPRYDPHPKKYDAAAARLGWKRTTLVKRIENLRARLDAAGVPNMTGYHALINLAEYAIGSKLVTREDLAMLRR